MKRLIYLATAALAAMMVMVPTALAQGFPGDTDPYAPEPNAIEVSHEELQQEAGQPPPSQDPGQHPGEVPVAPPQGLPQSGGPGVGGPTVILPAAALLLAGSGVLAYATLRRTGR